MVMTLNDGGEKSAQLTVPLEITSCATKYDCAFDLRCMALAGNYLQVK